jgi:hypothetical protein
MNTPDQKTVTVGTQSADALWASLAKQSSEQEPPPGSINAREFAKLANGLTLEGARQRLSRMVESGKATATPVRRIIGGQLRTVIYYTLTA